MRDVVVVGGGVAGLVAARDLAHAGRDVLLLDGAGRIGGKLCVDTVAGLTVDVGAEAMLARIGAEMQEKWPKVLAVSIVHRVGRCEVGEPSVVIAVGTAHRHDGCFEACQFAIERLKAIVPIWKQENWSDGQVWVEGPRQPDLDLGAPGE